jgi:AcrR family transcriptional regulator
MNHVMGSHETRGPDGGRYASTSKGRRRPRPTSLRDRQQAATRQAIIDAFLELARDRNSVAISIPTVADRAGLSVRTVYRYFPTKSELQTAAAFDFDDRARASIDANQIDGSNYPAYLAELWSSFANDLPAVTAQHATPAGRELRAMRLGGSRKLVRDAVPASTTDEVVDLIIAVSSSSMFLELVDRMGYPAARAAAMATRLIRLLAGELASEAGEPTDTKEEQR